MDEQAGDPGLLTSSVVRHSKNTIMGARSGWSKLSIHRVVWKRNDDSTEPTPTILPWAGLLDRKALDFWTDGILQYSFQSEWWASCRSEVALVGQCPSYWFNEKSVSSFPDSIAKWNQRYKQTEEKDPTEPNRASLSGRSRGLQGWKWIAVHQT